MADMVLDQPIATVPAKAAVVIDRLLINHLWLESQGDKWPARLNLSYFGRDGQGEKVFATDTTGARIMDELAVEDIFATGNPDIDSGIVSIMRGLLSLYLIKKVAETAEAQP